MNRDDIIRIAREVDLHERVKDGVGYVVRIPNLEKLERFAALIAAEKDKEIARLREENVYLKEALWAAAKSIEKLAFQLPAPNKQTPEFMMLAISIRKIVQGQEQPR